MKNIFKPTCISALISLSAMPQMVLSADYLTFATTPPGSASQEPAPNVIVSVDDSGSMGETGITALKNALKTTFTQSKIPDSRIRLAWQSMNSCNGIPKTGTACGVNNSLKILKGTHRTNFLAWVDTLNDGGGTPSHTMVRNAGDYLMRTDLGVNSPWASDPGTTETPLLGCRKSFHIFMTDGGWNSSATNTTYHIDADRKKTSYLAIGQGDIDGNHKTLPDGQAYTANSNTTKIFYDPWGFPTTGTVYGLNTLSDLAFYYWSTDLQPSIENKITPIIKKSGDEVFGTGANQKTIPQYWNPRNNPATWQNLTTYTIGFNDAATWTGSPTWGGDTYSGEYSQLIQGTKTWPSPLCGTDDNQAACDGSTGYSAQTNDRKKELWHMAINSRGKFIPATDANSLSKAFTDILDNIIADTSSPITAFASASSSISNGSTDVFVSSFDANGWKGGITAQTAAKGTGTLTPNTTWGTKTNGDPKSTGDILDAISATSDMTSRVIYTYNGGGKQFLWANLSSTTGDQQDLLKDGATGTAGTTLGQNRLNFIRGDRRQETANGGTLRDRVSRQGDIVNSTLWYTARPASGYGLAGYSSFATTYKNRMSMLYVGGNDGMLHGFSATDGTEKLAYVPQGVYKNLAALTKTDYQSNHKYYVDGSPFTGDVNISTTTTPDWRTLLVGTLGAGGKGYFVLDVTNPTNFTNSDTNATAIVRMDLTDEADADIGYIFGAPVTAEFNPQQATQITRMNDGRWAVVLGNGYNSANEDPVLIIQYFDGDSPTIRKIAAATGTTGNGSKNGLSTPRLVDLNGDGTADIAYAGDLKGNLWKFDLANSNPSKWGVAFNGSTNCVPTPDAPCTPFYTATEKINTTEPQPITTAPTVRPATSVGAMMVAFGTGQNLEVADRVDTSPQTFYALLDNTRYKLDTATGDNKGKILLDTDAATPTAVGSGRTNLIERTFNGTAIAGQVLSAGDDFWNMTAGQTAFAYTGTGAKKGWYFELPVPGERVLQTAAFVNGSNVLEVRSIVPASGGNTSGTEAETCTPTSVPAKAFRTYLGIEQGLKPTVQLLDADGDGIYNSASNKDNNTNRTTASQVEIGLQSGGNTKKIGTDKTREIKNLPTPSTTINWRQLQ